jgi:hypothetical protein
MIQRPARIVSVGRRRGPAPAPAGSERHSHSDIEYGDKWTESHPLPDVNRHHSEAIAYGCIYGWCR